MSVFPQILSQNVCLKNSIPGVKISEHFGHKGTSKQTPLFPRSITVFCNSPLFTLLTLMKDYQIPPPAKGQKDWL